MGRGVPAEPYDRTVLSEVRGLKSEVFATGQPFQRKERREFRRKEREVQPGNGRDADGARGHATAAKQGDPFFVGGQKEARRKGRQG